MSPITSTLANSSAYGYRSFAAAAGPAFESIATATSSGSSATLTFSSIPSTYSSLQIRFISKPASSGGAIRMQMNGITTNTYWYHYLIGVGTAAAAGSSGSATNGIFVMDNLTAPVADIFGVGIIDIHDYASTTKLKTIRSLSGTNDNTSGNGDEIQLWSGINGATTAVSSITFANTSGQNFASGTTFSLYGIKGA
jgi:hypothetical protein